MSKLSNARRAEVMKLLVQAKAQIRHAEVTSYNPATYAAKVTIQPEGVKTGWLPILSMWVGNGFGAYFGPNIGDQVIVAFIEASPDCGAVLGFLNTSAEVPPSVPSGQALIQDGQGSYIQFTNDGNIGINASVVVKLGNLTNALHKFVIDTFESLFNSHTHSGVTAGGSSTGTPNQTMNNTHMTTIAQGN